MDNSQIVNRLVSGTFYIECSGRVFKMVAADNETKQLGDLEYNKSFKSNRFVGLPSEKEIIEKYVDLDVIPKDYEKVVKDLSDEIDKLKFELFKCGPLISKAKDVRIQLNRKKKAKTLIYGTANEIEQNSIEGVAERARRVFIFCRCIYDENGKRAFDKTDDCQLYNQLMFKYSSMQIGEDIIREIARSGEWRVMWSANKYQTFHTHIADLSDEQRVVAHFSELYEFAYQHQKCPNKDVFNDNDVFDGWYLAQTKFKEDESDSGASMGNKDEKFQEVFVIAKDQEEADSIYDQNSDRSKKILRQRADVIKKMGVVRDIDLPDIQQDLMIQSNQKFRDAIHGDK